MLMPDQDTWPLCHAPSCDPAATARPGHVRSRYARPVARPVQAWELLPNGVRVARVGMRHRLVVRRDGRGRFRFAVLELWSGSGAVAHVAHGYAREAERAMAAAERVLASVPVHRGVAFASRPTGGQVVPRG